MASLNRAINTSLCYLSSGARHESVPSRGRLPRAVQLLDRTASREFLDRFKWKQKRNWLSVVDIQADLIHLGAKFSPCMKLDTRIQADIEAARNRERQTACCIRNDNSGCVQTSRAECSVSVSLDRWRWLSHHLTCRVFIDCSKGTRRDSMN